MTDDETAAFTRATAAVLGIPIDREHFASVVTNVQLLRRHADLVLGFSLPHDEDPDA